MTKQPITWSYLVNRYGSETKAIKAIEIGLENATKAGDLKAIEGFKKLQGIADRETIFSI